MKCLKKTIIGFGTFFSVFFLALLFSCLFGINNTYADQTVVLDSSNWDMSLFLCDSQGGPVDCSLYDKVSINYSYLQPSSIAFLSLSFGPNSHNFYCYLSVTKSCSFTYSLDSFNIKISSRYGLQDLVQNHGLVISIIFSNNNFDIPSGSLSIIENGTYDVTNYAEAIVDVPPEIVYGDYHDDLVNIKIGIYVCAGTLLVLYFFYCIYRLIIRNSGVK